jgi:hypothetical protein
MSALIIGVIIFVIGIISVVLYSVFSKKSNVTQLQPTASQIPAPAVGTPAQYSSIQEPKAGSLEWCKREVSKYKYVQEKPYDIIGFSMGRCDNYSDELEKVVINNNPSWKGSLFVGSKQGECLSKLQPMLDNFKTSGLADSKTIFGFRIAECDNYKDKVKTAMLGVNPGYLGTIEFS